MKERSSFSIFSGDKLVGFGALRTILVLAKARFDEDPGEGVLIFEDRTGRQVDFDLGGSIDEVLARAPGAEGDGEAGGRPGPGRPKLGVVSREISLMPRHWEWLEMQPNGISAALRRLVEEARKRDPEGDRARLAIEAASRFMTVMAGNRPGFEEASRALFAKDNDRFASLIGDWPEDIKQHLTRILHP